MNTTFTTPTHTIPTGFATPWNTYPTNWFAPGSAFAHAQPSFGYGYGPNGWWFGTPTGFNNSNSVGGVGYANTWNGTQTPWTTYGWNTPGVWNTPAFWNTPALWNIPWNYSTTPFNNVPSFHNQNWFGWNGAPHFSGYTPFNWGNGGFGQNFFNTWPTINNNGYPCTTFANTPSFTPFGSGQFMPNYGFGPGQQPFNTGFPVNTTGYTPFGTPWNTTNSWNSPATGFTGSNATPITGNVSPFGYTGGYQSFGNGVPAQGACTGREAA